jgi:hypothetical protein
MMLARLMAQSIRKGGQGDPGPVSAVEIVDAPKINTGT